MSSNPFRRQPPKDPLVEPPSTPAHATGDTVADGATGRKPSTSKKVVRIQTPPPLSPDPVVVSFGDTQIRRLSIEPRAGSPPPDVQLPVDAPPAAAALQLDPLSPSFGADITPQDPQVIANTRRNSEGGASSPPVALAAKVLNPFQRTLANIEPQNDSSQESAAYGTRNQSGSNAEGQIDVGSFTKMLMTGQGGPTPAEMKNAEVSGTAPSVSTTARGIPHNFDDLEDASSEDDGPLAPARSNSFKDAPPPPRHKHGKSVNERAPQTVAFNSFDDDFASANKPSSPADEPPRKASDSDASKRRMPPPPPLSRRPTSGHSEPSAQSEAAHGPSSKVSKPPPPPPTRRGANRNSVHAELAAANQDSTTVDESYDSATAKRALTPAHEPSSRSSSISDNRLAGGPPPPPTRRRRGSSKGSMDNQPGPTLRASSEARRAIDDNRRISQESIRRVPALGQVDEDENKPSQDILADLSAFQAEVDALRQSYRQS